LVNVPLLDAVIEARRRDLADLGDLVALRCSCTEGSQPVPKHLEDALSTDDAKQESPAGAEDSKVHALAWGSV